MSVSRTAKVALVIGGCVAAVGLVAVLATMVVRGGNRSLPFMLLGLLGLAQSLGAPFRLGSFVLFAFLAPTRGTRRGLIAAVMIELVIGVCALFHWPVPGSRM